MKQRVHIKNLVLVLLVLSSSAYSINAQNIKEAEAKPEGVILPRVETLTRNNINAIQGQCI